VDAEFDRLKVGDAVRFSEEPGVEGPQATTVHVASRHAPGFSRASQ
jgi:cold shock CspA family protein